MLLEILVIEELTFLLLPSLQVILDKNVSQMYKYEHSFFPGDVTWM